MVTDGLRSYTYDAERRLAASTTGATDTSPTTRYAHNALGQRVFKTEPLYPPSQGNAADPGFMQSLIAFFTKLCSPTTTQAEQLGYAYVYDEQGTLIAEVGSGGTNSAGQSQYIYLPTGNGPMPIAAIVNGNTYAIHSDHLSTPRKLTNANGQAVWQWGYSAFGEDKPTTARNRFANTETTPNPGTTNISEVKFNLRYPGQYGDEESGLYYNYFRSYDARTGRYSQPDPIGLDGGWNRFGYVDGNPLGVIDPDGLQFLDSTTLAGTRRGTSLDDAVRAGAWTRAITLPATAAALSPSALGLVSTPVLCVAPEAALTDLTLDQLKGIYGNRGVELFREFFKDPSRNPGLSQRELGAYREIARRALDKYRQQGND